MNVSQPEGSPRTKRFRLAMGAVISACLLVPLAVFGGTGLAQSSSAAKQYPSADQYAITICHHTHSKKHPMHTIRVSVKAWPAHKRHGDTLGECPKPSKPSKSHGHDANGQSGSHGNGKAHGK